MGSHYILVCLIVITLVTYGNLSPPRGSGRKKNTRPTEDKSPKKETRTKGQLSYGKTHLPINFNNTVESGVYKEHYSIFPDALFYPYSVDQRFNSSEEKEQFVKNCVQHTLEVNKNITTKCSFKVDLCESMMTKVLEFLCQDRYGKEPNGAQLFTLGFWVIPLVAFLSFVV